MSFAELLNSAAAQPRQLGARQIVSAVYVGNGYVSVAGCKCDVPLHNAERKNLPALDFRGDVLLVDLAQGDADPLAEEGSELVASFEMAADWNRINEAKAAGTAVEGTLVHKLMRRGGVFNGYKVRVGTVVGVITGKSLRGVPDAQDLLGKTISVDIVNADVTENKLEFSLRSVAEARRTRLEGTEIGELIAGKVAKLLDCGILVDVGEGACGLVHSSEIVRGTTFKVGDRCDVLVVAKDPERGRVSLSQRKAVRRVFARDAVIGEEFDGTVSSVKPYGVFVTVRPGITGLIHSSRFGKAYSEQNALSLLPSPLRVKLTKLDDQAERIDLALV
jgi:small subunit ribosomal protein S1